MRYAIIDKNGVIHSSMRFDEMEYAFDVMTNSGNYPIEVVDTWYSCWEGDLMLVEILNISR